MYDRPAIVTIPVRDVDPEFAAILMLIVADPVPLVAPAMAIHDAPDEAVHVQSPVVVRLTDAVAAAGPTVTPLLDNEDEHELAAWVTVNARPPISTCPIRWAEVEFGATVYCTVPSPSPGDPPVIVIHGTLLDADHVHPADENISTDPVAPAGPMEIAVGDRLKEHAPPA